ncbi:MAG: tRNA pseudouridine(13) synthase TruD [Pseudomonadota bacterium]
MNQEVGDAEVGACVPNAERAHDPNGTACRPEAPPFVTADLPGVGGRIGDALEDFRVDEIPAYTPSGSGEHWYVRVEKRGVTTPDLVRAIARTAGVAERDIGYAGLKDRHGVTTQWLSLPARAKAPELWELPNEARVLDVSRHGNKLRTGHLLGNRFRIVLVDVPPGGEQRAQAVVARLAERGLPNAFGAQRFGRDGDNLGRALAWLSGGGRARLSAFLYKLYPSVVQAEIFNRYLTLRGAEGFDRTLPGEVVRLEGSQATFVVEDAERETRRLLERDIHLTGPIWGPKMRKPRGRPLEIEERVLADLGVTEPMLEALGRSAPGARRDLVVPVRDLVLTPLVPDRLVLEFSLPAGSYATVLVRELTRKDSTAFAG